MQEQATTPYGYCKCGCGQKTTIAPQTVRSLGYVRGEPRDWIRGHVRKLKPDYETDGLCQCGCGRPAPIATRTANGNVVGFPKRFIRGHALHGPRIADRYEIQDRGYATPCWVWLLAKNACGYGITIWGLAHRVQYVAAKGPIPEGLELDHLCRVPACVNPDHLEAVTHAENMRRTSGTRTAPPKCGGCGRFLCKGVCSRCGVV